MIPVDQTILHGELQGNCMQASVASLLGLPITEVPHFAESGDAETCWDLFDDFLTDQGFTVIMKEQNFHPDCEYLASGRSPRGGNHMIVMEAGKLLHDPHPSRDGLVNVDIVYLIVPRRLC